MEKRMLEEDSHRVTLSLEQGLPASVLMPSGAGSLSALQGADSIPGLHPPDASSSPSSPIMTTKTYDNQK